MDFFKRRERAADLLRDRFRAEARSDGVLDLRKSRRRAVDARSVAAGENADAGASGDFAAADGGSDRVFAWITRDQALGWAITWPKNSASTTRRNISWGKSNCARSPRR
jgi:hypothetical protein